MKNNSDRPYEKTILQILAEESYDLTIEPFAGIARASRLLLNTTQTQHALLNDIEQWPTTLFGRRFKINPHDISPRIIDESPNNYTPRLDQYADQVSITRQDWQTFTSQTLKHLDPNLQTLYIYDPPYNDTTIHDQIIRHHTEGSTRILFAPAAYKPPTKAQTLKFDGPRQPEQAIYNW